MSDTAWQHADTVAQIVSAVGTLAAVVVALYLARHESRPRLSVSASRAHLVSEDDLQPSEVVLRISVTNAGFRDIMVDSVGWRIGVLRKDYFYQSLSQHPMTHDLPATLAPSARASFVFAWHDFLSKSEPIRRRLGRYRVGRIVRARSLRVTIGLSTGELLAFPITDDLRDALVNEPIGD